MGRLLAPTKKWIHRQSQRLRLLHSPQRRHWLWSFLSWYFQMQKSLPKRCWSSQRNSSMDPWRNRGKTKQSVPRITSWKPWNRSIRLQVLSGQLIVWLDGQSRPQGRQLHKVYPQRRYLRKSSNDSVVLPSRGWCCVKASIELHSPPASWIQCHVQTLRRITI